MAVPNAIITFLVATLFLETSIDDDWNNEDTEEAAAAVLAVFGAVMTFILYNRSRTSYNRWWEGGTLLQKTRGEWFNAFSSVMAFTSTKPEHKEEVDAYVHLLARLMSLLMCCGLQQVSPNRNRPFEILDLNGIDPASMDFLNSAPDKVEVILQWIQRSMVIHIHTGVLPVAPPILSRAFQEVSRGIVNLQNARKIADFPYPYPLAQISMILQLIHYIVTPFCAAVALPRGWAALFAFAEMFVLWCIHFNALDLEFPFGSRVNDLPMHDIQRDWNNSVCTLLAERATRPPVFQYDAAEHKMLHMVMSDASDLYLPEPSLSQQARRNVATIVVGKKKPDHEFRGSSLPKQDAANENVFRASTSVDGKARRSLDLVILKKDDLAKVSHDDIANSPGAFASEGTSGNAKKSGDSKAGPSDKAGASPSSAQGSSNSGPVDSKDAKVGTTTASRIDDGAAATGPSDFQSSGAPERQRINSQGSSNKECEGDIDQLADSRSVNDARGQRSPDGSPVNAADIQVSVDADAAKKSESKKGVKWNDS